MVDGCRGCRGKKSGHDVEEVSCVWNNGEFCLQISKEFLNGEKLRHEGFVWIFHCFDKACQKVRPALRIRVDARPGDGVDTTGFLRLTVILLVVDGQTIFPVILPGILTVNHARLSIEADAGIIHRFRRQKQHMIKIQDELIEVGLRRAVFVVRIRFSVRDFVIGVDLLKERPYALSLFAIGDQLFQIRHYEVFLHGFRLHLIKHFEGFITLLGSVVPVKQRVNQQFIQLRIEEFGAEVFLEGTMDKVIFFSFLVKDTEVIRDVQQKVF